MRPLPEYIVTYEDMIIVVDMVSDFMRKYDLEILKPVPQLMTLSLTSLASSSEPCLLRTLFDLFKVQGRKLKRV